MAMQSDHSATQLMPGNKTAFEDTVRIRRSIRGFLDKPVAEAVIREVALAILAKRLFAR